MQRRWVDLSVLCLAHDMVLTQHFIKDDIGNCKCSATWTVFLAVVVPLVYHNVVRGFIVCHDRRGPHDA